MKARRKTWAQLLARVYGVDALRCERCGARMRIIAWITNEEVIERILRHVGKWNPRRERSPPQGSAGAGGGWGGAECVEREWDLGA